MSGSSLSPFWSFLKPENSNLDPREENFVAALPLLLPLGLFGRKEIEGALMDAHPLFQLLLKTLDSLLLRGLSFIQNFGAYV